MKHSPQHGDCSVHGEPVGTSSISLATTQATSHSKTVIQLIELVELVATVNLLYRCTDPRPAPDRPDRARMEPYAAQLLGIVGSHSEVYVKPFGGDAAWRDM